jgi:hypothetical protein
MSSATPQAPGAPARSLHEICEDTRRGQCGLCSAMPSEACAFSGTGPDGYHVARFAWAEARGLISTADVAAVLETIAGRPFGNATVIYDGQPEGAMNLAGDDQVPGPLGPFATSGDALLALRPEDGSYTGREALFDLLKRTLHETDVTLAGWDWCVLRWLAGQDVQTVAAIAGWVGRSNGDLRVYGGGEGLEPHCAECGHWIGMFYGMDGWHHFRGDPAPGGQRQLFDAGHQAAPAWCEPPGRAISPADASVLGQALADAEAYRRERAAGWCADCQEHPAGACEGHVDDLDQADAYRQLADALEAVRDE